MTSARDVEELRARSGRQVDDPDDPGLIHDEDVVPEARRIDGLQRRDQQRPHGSTRDRIVDAARHDLDPQPGAEVRDGGEPRVVEGCPRRMGEGEAGRENDTGDNERTQQRAESKLHRHGSLLEVHSANVTRDAIARGRRWADHGYASVNLRCVTLPAAARFVKNSRGRSCNLPARPRNDTGERHGGRAVRWPAGRRQDRDLRYRRRRRQADPQSRDAGGRRAVSLRGGPGQARLVHRLSRDPGHRELSHRPGQRRADIAGARRDRASADVSRRRPRRQVSPVGLLPGRVRDGAPARKRRCGERARARPAGHRAGSARDPDRSVEPLRVRAAHRAAAGQRAGAAEEHPRPQIHRAVSIRRGHRAAPPERQARTERNRSGRGTTASIPRSTSCTSPTSRAAA